MQPRPATSGRTLALCTVSMLAMVPGIVRAQGLLGDINGTPTGGVTPVANTWQQYTYTFTATLPSTYITFLFKNNPDHTGLDDIALALAGGGSNLVLNPGLETPGTVISPSVTIPANWISVGTPGLSFPGTWFHSSPGMPGNGGTHTGSGMWLDGAIDGFDGIAQATATTVGQSYTLTFWLGSKTVPDGTQIDSKVIAGLNIDTLQLNYAASQIGVTVNSIFEGGTLLLDQPGATYGQSFTLDGSGSNTIDQNGNNATFTGIFSNAVPATPGGIIIANSGSGGAVTFTGTNTYTGGTTINAGATLALSGTGSIATSSGLLDNGAFDISGTTSGASIVSLAGSGTVALGAQTLTLTNAASTFSGSIGGSGGLTVAGGTEQLSGANAYTGGTTINSGATLKLSGSGSIAASSGVLDSGTLNISLTSAGATIATLSGGGTVVLGARTLTLTNASSSFAGVIGGAGGFALTGGTETLSGVDTFTGPTTVGSGATLALSGSGSIAASSGMLDSGSFDISATSAGAAIASLSGAGTVVLGARTLTLTNGAAAFTGVIDGSGGIAVTGGIEVLGGVNTFGGPTTIGGGATLALTGTGRIAASSGVLDNGTFDSSLTSAGASIATLGGAGTVVLGTRTLTFTNASSTFGGVIGGSGGIAVTGGTEVLGGTNSYTGASTIGSGATLALTGSGSIAASSDVLDSGTLDISLTSAGASIATLSGGGTVVLGARTLTLTNASSSFAGVIGGSGGFALTGGTETLSGVNTFTGPTTIGSGATLALSGSGSIAASSGVLDSGTLDISLTSAGASIASLSGAGTVVLGAQTLALTDASGTFSGAIGGSGGLAIVGGSQALTGVSTYGGGTSVNGAVLAVNSDAALGVGTGGLVLADGTLTALAPLTSSRPVLLAGTIDTVNTGGFGVSLGGVLSGSGGLIATGGGQLVLGAANTYSGTTTIAAGTTLGLSDAGSIAASLGVADAGTFDISAVNGPGTSIASLSGAGSVALGHAILTLTAANDTFSGAIGGGGGLTVAAGQETLSGGNSFTGPTTIGGGAILALAGAGSIAASSGVADGGQFDISAAAGPAVPIAGLSGGGTVLLGSNTLVLSNASTAFSGTIGGSGGVAVNGGTQTLLGSNTYTGGTSVTNAALAVNGDAALGAPSGGLSLSNGTLVALGTLASARAVLLTRSSTVNTGTAAVTLSGKLSGSGGLTVGGSGRLALIGTTNSYAGGTTISGGSTLAIGSDAALGASGATLSFNNGTLLALGGFSTPRPIIVTTGGGNVDANGFLVLLTGPITLNGPLNSIGAGQVSFSNTAQVNGNLNITNGTFTNAGTINALSVTVGPTATLSGTGTINAPTTVDGVLAPGNSPGTLIFTAPLTLAATSTTELAIDGTGTGTGAGNFSRVLVTSPGNTATVGGTLVPLLRGISGEATNTFTPPLGQTFVVIAADGGIVGSYAGLTQPTGRAAGTRFDALYGPTTLTLVVTPGLYGNLGLAGLTETASEAAVGRALDAIRPAAGLRMDAGAAALFDPLYRLSGPAIPSALDQFVPGIYGDGLLAARGAWYAVTEFGQRPVGRPAQPVRRDQHHAGSGRIDHLGQRLRSVRQRQRHCRAWVPYIAGRRDCRHRYPGRGRDRGWRRHRRRRSEHEQQRCQRQRQPGAVLAVWRHSVRDLLRGRAGRLHARRSVGAAQPPFI